MILCILSLTLGTFLFFMKNDFRVAIFIIVLGVLYLLGANTINQAGSSATVGPRAFPIGIGTLMILSGVWLVISTRNKQQATLPQDELEVVDWRTFGMSAALLIFYAITQPIIGFLIATPLLVYGQTWIFGSRHYKRDIAVSILLPLLVYIAFNYALRIKLG